MADNLETIQLGTQDFPTYKHLENELMSAKDHILIVGEYLKKPLGSLSEVPGFDLVKNNLKEELGLEIGNSLQLHTASYILAGRNVFVIGSASSDAGKSLAYTVPIISKLRLDAEKNALPSGYGPIALVICGTPKSGIKIEEALKFLTDDSGVEVEFVKDISQQTEEPSTSRIRYRRAAASTKGCDVMVATAECAAAVINDPRSWFSFDRLTYIILDDAHMLFKYRLEYVRSILGDFKSYISKLGYCNRLVQTVVCGSQWSEEMENGFDKLCDNPVLIMGSPVQAIRFGKFGIQVVQVSAQAKFQSLKEILLRHESARRVLVVASKWDTINELKSYFEHETIPIHFLIGEGEIGAATANARRKWNANTDGLVVFATDGNLSELQIADADILIHFDIPQDDLRVFALRFSSMWRIVEDRVSHPKEAQKVNEQTLSYVLLEEDLPQKNVILWKLHSLGASISSQMLKEATEAREASLDRQTLCKGFITTGNCTELDIMECNFRHHFVQADFDQQRVLPLSGQVELYITEVKTPNHFTAKVLRYCSRDPVSKKVTSFIDFGAEAARRHELLKEAVTTGAIRNGPSSAKPGTKVVVALRDKEDSRYVYTRGVIEEVVTRIKAGLAKTCKVYCMDIGLRQTIRVDDIFGIPEDMESLPPCSLTVVLANTAPPFGGKKFHLLHMRKARPNFQLDPKFQAEICLSVGGTIWVRRLVKMKKIQNGKVIEDWDATYNLCKQGILARNPGHMEKMYASCENVGFSCEEYRRLKKKVTWTNDIDFRLDYYQANDPYQWAHLRIHDENKSGIISTTATPQFIDPSSNIFVNQIVFEILAENLETELTDEILDLKASHDWNKDEKFESYYVPGLVVAVLDEDGKYRRGMIVEAEKEEDGDSSKMRFHILLVDLGVSAWLPIENLYPLPKKFVPRLPFQAIKLKLLHIRPRRAKSPNDKMHRAVIEILLRNGIPDDIEVVAFQKLERSNPLDPNTYEAFIFGADAELGETLVGMKKADFIEDGERRVRIVKEQLLEKFRSGIAELEDDDYGDDSDDDGLEFEFGAELTKYLDKVVSDAKSSLKASKAEAGRTEKQTVGSIRLDNGPKSSAKCKELQLERTTIGSNELQGKVMKTPAVAWLQNTASVFIRVLLPDVAEYTCHVTDRINLIFETINPPNYGFTLKLSKRVESAVEVQPFGQYTKIELKKRNVGVRWEVLTPTTGLRWLKPELEFEDDDDDVEEKGRKLLEYIPVDHEAMLEDLEDDDEEIFDFVEETDDYFND